LGFKLHFQSLWLLSLDLLLGDLSYLILGLSQGLDQLPDTVLKESELGFIDLHQQAKLLILLQQENEKLRTGNLHVLVYQSYSIHIISIAS
jgi:hypothetical protein